MQGFYYCHLVVVIIGFFLFVVKAQQPCSRGWSWNSANTHCYKYNSSLKLSWPDAQRYCLSEGGYLVKIDSADENTFLKKIIKSHSWIGAFQGLIMGTGTFLWSFDWQPLNFTSWSKGEPNNYNNNEPCGQMFPDGGWNDISCEYSLSFVCEKEPDFCLLNNGGCPQVCFHIDGKAECSCNTGFTSFANGSICLDLLDTLTQNKSWERKCRSDNITSALRGCSCVLGYSSVKVGNVWICSDVNECGRSNGGCQHACVNTAGSYKCTCNYGFMLAKDGRSCTSFIDLLNNTAGVQPCINGNSSSSCRCNPGYSPQNVANTTGCFDTDECLYDNGQCQHTCVNTAGSYKCNCGSGYVLNSDGRSCLDILILVNNTISIMHPCLGNTSQECRCKKGYSAGRLGPTPACFDIDECHTNNGGCQQNCVNTAGSFLCSCDNGFIINQDSKTCTDLPALLNTSGKFQPCLNKEIKKGCQCKFGFQPKKLSSFWICTDQDECAVGVSNGGCDHICINTPGSFICTCRDGFIKIRNGRICQVPNSGSTVAPTNMEVGSSTNMTEEVTSSSRVSVLTTEKNPSKETKDPPEAAKQTGWTGQSLFNANPILIVLLGLLVLLLLLNIMLFVYFAMSMSLLRASIRGERHAKNAKLSGAKRHCYNNFVYDANLGEENQYSSIGN